MWVATRYSHRGSGGVRVTGACLRHNNHPEAVKSRRSLLVSMNETETETETENDIGNCNMVQALDMTVLAELAVRGK